MEVLKSVWGKDGREVRRSVKLEKKVIEAIAEGKSFFMYVG